jgi:hypothetical protein
MFIIIMDISGSFSNIILQYNKNIRDYNDNMRLYLEVIRQNQPNIRNRSSYDLAFYSPTRRSTNNILSSLFTPLQNISLENTSLQDVIVIPTSVQIANATEIIQFNESISNNNISCPITLDSFVNGENVCRIKHCSHLFKQNALHNWFRRNVRCPVCRYDIRDYRPDVLTDEDEIVMDDDDDDDEDDEDDEYSEIVNELLNERQTQTSMQTPTQTPTQTSTQTSMQTPTQTSMQTSTQTSMQTPTQTSTQTSMQTSNPNPTYTRNVSNVTNVIREFINNELANLPTDLSSSASELLYTFDIPLMLDMSGNLRL